DIVRMDFTFTQSSYVDRYLDYINISLDNGLWQGRYWLPNQQRVEIRRRIPELDIPAGSVIRANVQVGNYRFDEPLPPAFFSPRRLPRPRGGRPAACSAGHLPLRGGDSCPAAGRGDRPRRGAWRDSADGE